MARKWTGAGLLVALAAAGCGGAGTVGVEGSVSYNGEPVTVGTIAFVPVGVENGKIAGGPIRDGKYKVEPEFGPLPGKYKVQVNWRKVTGKTLSAAQVGASEGGEGVTGGKIPEVVEGIPAKFNDKTELTAELVPGENKLDYALTGPATAIPLIKPPVVDNGP